MKLSVVILNYNVSPFLEVCLRSVQKAISAIEAEIIVVDNLSSDDSCAMVSEKFPSVILIQNKANFGFSKGNNIGVKKAKGDFVCILNPDTIVPEDVFIKALDFAEKQENFGALGCQLIDGRGQFLPESKRNIPTPLVAFKKILGLQKSYYHTEIPKDFNAPCNILVGAFMLIKSQVYQQVQGFDEDYFMYGEDIDLSYRILKSGFQNYYLGEVSVIHFKGESTLKDKNYAERFYGAMTIFYKKHFGSNKLVDVLVKQLITLAQRRPQKSPQSAPIYNDIVIVTPNKSSFDGFRFFKPVSYVAGFTQLESNTMYVFDEELISYQDIIEILKQNCHRTNVYYRIKPKNCNFILGSDTSINRGEVLWKMS